MKKLSAILLFLMAVNSKGQVAYETSYPFTQYSPLCVINFSNITRYVVNDFCSNQIKVYDLNHSLYKAITIPAQTGVCGNDWYIANNLGFSETLFNSDPLFEYIIVCNNPATTGMFDLKIYNENGIIIFQEDSVANMGVYLYKTSGGAKMVVPRYINATNYKNSIYSLSGTLYNKVKEINSPETELNIYPNPSANYFKVAYKLPGTIKEAVMEIYDMKGALQKTYKISSDFEDILIEDKEISAGTYTVKISSGASVISSRIIKL